MIRVVDVIFGTEVALVDIPAQRQAGVFTVLRSMDKVFSRFRADSEVSAIDRAAGNWVSASPVLLSALDAASQHAIRTAGIFNPLLGVEVAATGYRTNFDPRARWRSEHTPPRFEPPSIEIDHDRLLVRISEGTAVDLDGFSKGWLGQQLARQLETMGVARALIDIGGDIVAWAGERDLPWRVALARPHLRQPPFHRVHATRIAPSACRESGLRPRSSKHERLATIRLTVGLVRAMCS